VKSVNDATAAQIITNQVVVRAGPSATATALRTLSSSDVFAYIYKYDSCVKSSWFLVGTRSGLSQFSGAEETIIGWIPRLRAAEWSTREAFEPAPDRKSPANIFRTEEAMKSNDLTNAFIDRMQRGVWPADKWRYILMSQSSDGQEAKIGFLDDLLIVNQVKPSTVDTALAKALQDLYAGPLTNVNFIFVMDATKGMGPYLKVVADTLEAAAAPIQNDSQNINLQYGAVVYRDRANLPKERFDIVPLTTDVQQVARFLRNQRDPTSGDRDFEEALFDGLRIALEEVAEPNKENILIVVGDAGNADAKSPLNEAAIRKAVGTKRPLMYALHIQRPASEPAEAVAIAKFESDMARVFSIVTSVRSPGTAEFVNTLPASDRSLLTQVVTTKLERTSSNQEDLQGVATRIAQQIRSDAKVHSALAGILSVCVERGTCSTPPSPTPAPNLYEVRSALLDLIAQEVENPDLLRALIRDKVQIFQTGWVKLTDPNGAPLMRPMYLVSQDELLSARGVLTEFTSYGGTDAVGLVRIWRNTVEQACGCKADDPEDYVRMRSGLSFASLSGFLSKSWEELARARPEELVGFLRLAKAAIDRIDKLRYNEAIWFKNYGERFAWIPAAELP
jgi:hypothetical protein